MSNIVKAIRSLPKFSGYKKTSNVEISKAEIQLCLPFADEYKEYLAEFGEASAKGLELTGIIDADYINVVTATKEKWDMYPQIPHNLYVVEDTNIDGIIIWQDATGAIYKSTPNTDAVIIAYSLTEYITSKRKN
jgi:hypothetical protein